MKADKAPWLVLRHSYDDTFNHVKKELKERGLVTVCEEAACPNINRCWNRGTATLMILGDTCTRGCRFCNVKTAKSGQPIDSDEPRKVVEIVERLNLSYVVITSVDRDDLPDQGAGHFAACIRKIKEYAQEKNKTIRVEVLIPDFRGNEECLNTIIDARPDVIAHNMETVRRLQRTVRDVRANYEQSLGVLEYIKSIAKQRNILTKTSLMLGLGEEEHEIIECMQDLRKINCDIITFGQYLQPTKKHLEVKNYVRPEQFDQYKANAFALGFLHCVSAPFARSSYRAEECLPVLAQPHCDITGE